MNRPSKVVSIERSTSRPRRIQMGAKSFDAWTRSARKPRKQISLDAVIIIFGCAMLFLGLVWGFAIAQAVMQ